jgi:hypothetical protein
LISCTEARAFSALAQKPASACRASSALRRSNLAGRSKKVSKVGHPLLQLGEAVVQVGHVAGSWIGVQGKNKRIVGGAAGP